MVTFHFLFSFFSYVLKFFKMQCKSTKFFNNCKVFIKKNKVFLLFLQ
jgi:hypothetical protein